MSYAYPENCSSVYILFISTWHKFDYNFCLQICDCNNEQHCLNRFNVLFRHCLYSTKSASFVPRISHRIVDDFLWFKLFSTVFIGDKPFYLSRLFIVGKQTNALNNGEIGIFYLDGKTYCKQLKNDADGVFLVSLNSKYEPIPVAEDSSFKIFGRVLN